MSSKKGMFAEQTDKVLNNFSFFRAEAGAILFLCLGHDKMELVHFYFRRNLRN